MIHLKLLTVLAGLALLTACGEKNLRGGFRFWFFQWVATYPKPYLLKQ